ncbi:hypothetical protein RB3337 [Rhodopirellula baltica SH 1]|uniref:Uncharacterized protein n=1 Tax=Rhodopirellula baltica (strain DSM 10527 / NCIMB 13988 / SH1) TaxID=243090 RepID=Q7UUE8_RHOBA|nr:hypothetical protein RB3337 [Rhodopirellula baltica SH 1]
MEVSQHNLAGQHPDRIRRLGIRPGSTSIASAVWALAPVLLSSNRTERHNGLVNQHHKNAPTAKPNKRYPTKHAN